MQLLDVARITHGLDIAVVGLGYVGLPLALALARHHRVIGFDIHEERIRSLSAGVDVTGESSPEELATAGIRFTTDSSALRQTTVFIIAVPTPVDSDKLPDLNPLLSACRTVGQALNSGDLVIFESTVYPGATEEECVPVLSEVSGLVFNRDYFVGYSPERINPGDRLRRLPDIVKVTSGSNNDTADFVDALYRQIVPAGTHKAPSIRVAEAAKAVENTQRDINIAFANELAMIFSRMGIDTNDVLDAASTKWNFMPVRPGLVGGHCIGVDPYYLIHKAKAVGASPMLIQSAREINEGMAAFVISRFTEIAKARSSNPANMRILVLGITFKENCADIRNSRAFEVIHHLRAIGADVTVHDPVADARAVQSETPIGLSPPDSSDRFDAIVLAVAHREFLTPDFGIDRYLAPEGWIMDIKGALPRNDRTHRLSD